MKKIIMITVMTCFIIKAFSQQPSSSIANCDNAKTQIEINECSKAKFLMADRELNNVYKKIIGLLQPDQQQTFVTSQKRWIEYRNVNCNVYGDLYKGGSIMEMVIVNCKTRVTLDRIKELNILLEEIDK